MSETMSVSRRRNALFRHHGADHPSVKEAELDLRAAHVEQAIRENVDQAPPLGEERISQLRQLLTPAPAE